MSEPHTGGNHGNHEKRVKGSSHVRRENPELYEGTFFFSDDSRRGGQVLEASGNSQFWTCEYKATHLIQIGCFGSEKGSSTMSSFSWKAKWQSVWTLASVAQARQTARSAWTFTNSSSIYSKMRSQSIAAVQPIYTSALELPTESITCGGSGFECLRMAAKSEGAAMVEIWTTRVSIGVQWQSCAFVGDGMVATAERP